MSKALKVKEYSENSASEFFIFPVTGKAPKGGKEKAKISLAILTIDHLSNVSKYENDDKLRFRNSQTIQKYLKGNAIEIIQTSYTLADVERIVRKIRNYHSNKEWKNRINRGWAFEYIVYHTYGKRWKGLDTDKYYEKGDIKLNNKVYQIKYFDGEF